MKFCLKCNGTGRVLEQRLSDYANSYDYYPISCPDCSKTEKSLNNRQSAPTRFNFEMRKNK